jgi:hypothetical protein
MTNRRSKFMKIYAFLIAFLLGTYSHAATTSEFDDHFDRSSTSLFAHFDVYPFVVATLDGSGTSYEQLHQNPRAAKDVIKAVLTAFKEQLENEKEQIDDLRESAQKIKESIDKGETAFYPAIYAALHPSLLQLHNYRTKKRSTCTQKEINYDEMMRLTTHANGPMNLTNRLLDLCNTDDAHNKIFDCLISALTEYIEARNKKPPTNVLNNKRIENLADLEELRAVSSWDADAQQRSIILLDTMLCLTRMSLPFVENLEAHAGNLSTSGILKILMAEHLESEPITPDGMAKLCGRIIGSKGASIARATTGKRTGVGTRVNWVDYLKGPEREKTIKFVRDGYKTKSMPISFPAYQKNQARIEAEEKIIEMREAEEQRKAFEALCAEEGLASPTKAHTGKAKKGKAKPKAKKQTKGVHEETTSSPAAASGEARIAAGVGIDPDETTVSGGASTTVDPGLGTEREELLKDLSWQRLNNLISVETSEAPTSTEWTLREDGRFNREGMTLSRGSASTIEKIRDRMKNSVTTREYRGLLTDLGFYERPGKRSGSHMHFIAAGYPGSVTVVDLHGGIDTYQRGSMNSMRKFLISLSLIEE